MQLTSRSLEAEVVRRSVPTEFVIGVSTHSVQGVRAASSSGADFAVFGPVFETPGKSDAQGLDALRDICAAVSPYPVIAIGGIDAGNYASVLDAGAAGYGAIRWLNDFEQLKTER